MNSVVAFFNQGWVGALLGALGIGFAVYQIFKRSDAKPVFQYSGQKLISSGSGLLPNEVSVQFNGATVPRISLTYIVFWNHGQATIRGSDIADNYPLAFAFEGGQILKVETIKATRNAIEASSSISEGDASRLHAKFSFLDANDGFVLKVLHTAAETKPVFEGTIMGVPRGVKSFGRIMGNQSRKSGNFAELLMLSILSPSWTVIIAFIIVGSIGVSGAVYPDMIMEFIEKRDLEVNAIRIAMGFVGALYIIIGFYTWMRIRRRFPSAINLEES